AEVLGLDAERVGERLHDVVRRHRPVAMDEMVQVSRRQAGALGQRPVREAALLHEALDSGAERLLAEATPTRHPASFSSTLPASSPSSTRASAPFARWRTSTAPSSSVFLSTVRRSGHAISY